MIQHVIDVIDDMSQGSVHNSDVSYYLCLQKLT